MNRYVENIQFIRVFCNRMFCNMQLEISDMVEYTFSSSINDETGLFV